MEIPAFISPMLASPGMFFQSQGHLYEPKWDGIRCQAIYHEKLQLLSRNGRDITLRFPELTHVHHQVEGQQWILDGELIVLDRHGKPSFDLVRNRNLLTDPAKIQRMSTFYKATLIVFDILMHCRYTLLSASLAERRTRLLNTIQPNEMIRISSGVVGAGPDFHTATALQGLEGTMIKDLSSPYIPGQRTTYWVKVRHVKQTDCVIGGFLAKNPYTFGSLLLGQYTVNRQLVCVGHVGTGFTDAQNTVITQNLRKLIRPTSPFGLLPKSITHGVTWVTPVIVCVVDYLAWTPEGMLRHPVFRGIRSDKSPHECELDEGHPHP